MARADKNALGKIASLVFVVLMFALVVFFALRLVPKAERPILGPPPSATTLPSVSSSASTSTPAATRTP